MLNKVILMGRLCADPEFRQTTSGVPVCRIRVAVNRPKQKDQEQKADFINVSCWRNTAEFVSRYFTKGKMIIVEGTLRNNDYTDNNGVKHYSMDVLAQNVAFGEAKGSGDQQGQQQYGNQYAQAGTPQFGTVQAPAGNPYAPQGYAGQPMQDALGTPMDALSVGDLAEFEEILSDGEVPF